jgi:hypothetical protein
VVYGKGIKLLGKRNTYALPLQANAISFWTITKRIIRQMSADKLFGYEVGN